MNKDFMLRKDNLDLNWVEIDHLICVGNKDGKSATPILTLFWKHSTNMWDIMSTANM